MTFNNMKEGESPDRLIKKQSPGPSFQRFDSIGLSRVCKSAFKEK